MRPLYGSRTSGTESFEREKYYMVDAPRTEISLRNKMGWALYVPLVTLVQNSLTAAVFLLGGRMVMQGKMSGSDFAAFMVFSEGVHAVGHRLHRRPGPRRHVRDGRRGEGLPADGAQAHHPLVVRAGAGRGPLRRPDARQPGAG